MRVAFENINGIRTRYYHAGSGTPLLLVHGAGVSADNWIHMIGLLSRDFRVIAPDTLGHGFTGRGNYQGGPPQPYMVDHLVALIEKLGLERLAIGGSSYGAMLSMLVYFRLKQRVDRLVFFSSASTTLTDEERAVSTARAYANGSSAIRDPDLDRVKARLGRIFHDASRIPPELPIMQLTIYSQPEVQESYEMIMRGMMDFEKARPWSVRDRFNEIEAPLLMLWGLDDRQVKYERAVEAGRAAREAYLVGMENCSHEPHVEHPERSAALVRRFLLKEPMDEYRVR